MADVYVYTADATDFSTMGLCGALMPTSCQFCEEINGESAITLTHPLDSDGRYMNIVRGRILVACVPVRTTPEIESGAVVTSVESWTVKSSATAAQRAMYSKDSGGKKLRTLSGGLDVIVTKHGSNRYKIKTSKYGTGWIDPDALEYVTAQTLENNANNIEAIQPAWTIKPQLFRIYSVEKSMEEVVTYARHITYDLLGNLTTYENAEAASAQAMLTGILNGCSASHDFFAYTNLADTRTGVKWTRVSPINALLDPETGFVAKIACGIVRDNWEMFFLADPGINRGVTIEYRKNMTGIRATDSDESVITRIVPVGENKDGSDLLLDGTQYVDSEHAASYPAPHVAELKCTDCKVGTNGVTVAIARQRMQEQAEAEFAAECDLPRIEMKVEFVSLGDTEEYKQFKNLESLFLYDYVLIRHTGLNVNVTARIASITWDCIAEKMLSMDIGNVGTTLANTNIATWQIPSGFSGSKIAAGTVASAQIGGDVINVRHMQAESINTDALQAYCVTALKIAASAITADKLDADTVDAKIANIALAQINTANIQNANIDWAEIENLSAVIANIAKAQITTANIGEADIEWAEIGNLVSTVATIARAQITTANIVEANIDWAQISTLSAQMATVAIAQINTLNVNQANIDWASISALASVTADIADARIGQASISIAQIDQLEAEVARILSVEISTGEFDFASIQNLVASAMVLEQGTGGSIYITNLAVTSATILSATMGELVVQGEDGKYYEITVMTDGTIATKEVTVTEGEIATGETEGGKGIVATTANVAELNAQTVKASSAIISEILVGALTAEKITAQQALIASATVPELYATSIKAIGDSLDLSSNQSIRLYVSDEIEGLEIGGRNYLRDSLTLSYASYGVVARSGGVTQEGTVLCIVQGVTVTQTGSTLTIS